MVHLIMVKIQVAAIIAEFNPLHRGHEYVITRARELTGASHVLIVQSGNFVQRAEPAILEKHIRAESAIRAGADAVVEIPSLFATGNAEVFAKASVKIATSFPHVTHLVFGTESKDLELLRTIAATQVNNTEAFERYMASHLVKGISFDKARTEVIKRLLPSIGAETIERAMKTPNNILAIEYLKELCRAKSSVKAVGVQRIDGVSSTQIRQELLSSVKQLALGHNGLPMVAPTISNKVKNPEFLTRYHYENFGSMALFAIMTKLNTTIYNSNEELVNLLRNSHPTSYAQMKLEVPTKRFSVSRIARLALHCALGVTRTDVEHLYRNEWLPYTNLLAIRACEDKLFSSLCINSRTPLVVRGNKIKPRTTTAFYKACKRIDEKAELMYEAITGRKHSNTPRFVEV